MPVYIHDIATAVPETYSKQDFIREQMKKYVGKDRKTRAIIHRIYSQSGIEKRHTVINDFSPDHNSHFFFNGSSCNVPGTAQRNDIYREQATKLFTDIGKMLLEQNPEIDKSDITHVITVSCTGFFAPGPDFEVVKQLGLNPSTQRFHVGFMGCYAAFSAMKMADAFCKSNPDAVVMMICTELCTLHFQSKTDIDSLLSASVFSDGAAGALISQRPPSKTSFEILDFASSLAYEGEKDMAWIIGNTGFDMILSSYVPDIIESNIQENLAPVFEKYRLSASDIDHWALHPGGRAIVDKIQKALNIQDDQIVSSRKVLAEHGNMSSATVLFVLRDLLSRSLPNKGKVVPVAFGPGLTIESGLFEINNPN